MPLIWFCDPSFSNCFSLQHHPLTSRHCQLSSSKPSTIQPFQHLIVIWYSTSTPVVIFLPSAFSSCHITLSYCHLSIFAFQASARTPPFHLYYQHSPFSTYSVWPHLSSSYRRMLLIFKSSSPLNSSFHFSLVTISCFIIYTTPSWLDDFPSLQIHCASANLGPNCWRLQQTTVVPVVPVVPVEKDIFCAALCSAAVVYCSLLIVLL